MNKTISISLGNVFFHIEDEAYRALKSYLDAIYSYFRHEDGENIVEDIEARLSELFQEQLGKHKREMVLFSDVQMAVNIIGLPEQFDAPTGEASRGIYENAETNEEKGRSRNWRKGEGGKKRRRYWSKQFKRSREDRIFGGVAGGLAKYFGISDPLWIRIGLLFSVFLGIGIVIPFYILLWIFVPKEGYNFANKNEWRSNGGGTLKDRLDEFHAEIREMKQRRRAKRYYFYTVQTGWR